jgi:hypothetical protein
VAHQERHHAIHRIQARWQSWLHRVILGVTSGYLVFSWGIGLGDVLADAGQAGMGNRAGDSRISSLRLGALHELEPHPS